MYVWAWVQFKRKMSVPDTQASFKMQGQFYFSKLDETAVNMNFIRSGAAPAWADVI